MTATLKSLGNGAFFRPHAFARRPPLCFRVAYAPPRAPFAHSRPKQRRIRTPFPVSRRSLIPCRTPTPPPFRFHRRARVSAQAFRAYRLPWFRLPPPDALRRLNDEGDGTTMPPPVLFRQIADYFSMVSMVRCVLVNTQMSAAMAMDSFTISEGVMDV